MSLGIAWLLIFALIQFTPTLIILFSGRVKGRKKLYWVLVSLMSVIVLPIITITVYNGDFSEHGMLGYSYLYVWLILCIFILMNSRQTVKKANKTLERNS